MINGYPEFVARELRLTLLQLLAQMANYRGNSEVLLIGAQQLGGFDATRAQVRTQLAWLAEQGLATTDEPRDGLVVATLTERGVDVAEGRSWQPGVARPAAKL